MPTTTLNTGTISLSVAAIKESIYALSALHAYLSDEKDALPPILTRAHSSALTGLIRQGAIYVAMELSDLGMDIVSTDEDMVVVSLTAPGDVIASLRHALETAVEMRVMQCCFLSHDSGVAGRYASDCAKQVEMMRNKAGANTEVPSLRPVRY